MKIIKRSTNKVKVTLIILAIIVLATAGYGVVAYFNNLPPFQKTDTSKEAKENDINNEPATEEEKKAGMEAKKDFIERHENDDTSDGTSNGSGSNQKANVTLTSVSQDGSTLQVRSIIDGIDNEGTCKVVLSKSGQQSVENQSGTQAMNSYTVCKGFDIDSAALVKGEWNVTIEYAGKLGAGSAGSRINIK